MSDFDITPHLWVDARGLGADPWYAAAPEEVRRIYDEKWRLANLLRPERVAEFGVRAGYAAAVFLACGTRHYVGFDSEPLEEGCWGGNVGAVAFARRALPQHFPAATVRIHHLDTQATGSLAEHGPVDLVHVDANHSLEGCLHDLGLALTLRPRWILADDFFHHSEVRAAAETFARRQGLHGIAFPTLRGDFLLDAMGADG